MSAYTIRMRMAGALAVCVSAWLGNPRLTHAESEPDATAVRCILQSASLNFGKFGLKQPTPMAGEGEAVVACQNVSTEVRRVDVSLAFPSMGSQTAYLQSAHASVAVAFYRDAQFAWRWGDDRNGFTALHIPLVFAPGERKELRTPVFALLHHPRNAAAGVYRTQVPVTLTTLPK